MNQAKRNLIENAMDRLFAIPGHGWETTILHDGDLMLIGKHPKAYVVVPKDTFTERNATNIVLWVKEHYDHNWAMSIPTSHVNYIRFALQEIQQANLAIRDEARSIPDALQEKWLLNQAECLDRAEGYINKALEVKDGRSTDTEGAEEGDRDESNNISSVGEARDA